MGGPFRAHKTGRADVVEGRLAPPGAPAPRVVLAAGAGTDADGIPIIGTDAMKVATAIDELADTDGVLVLMDLGSAVLSAELALELRMSDVEVTLSAAPFVEGLLAAVVRAAGGASLAEVAAEARGALAPKSGQLGEAEAAPAAAPEAPSAAESDRITRRLTLRNPLGLHARPAALLATEAGRAENARLALLRTGATVAAASPTALIGLGSRGGDEIEISAAGPDAAAVLDRIQTLVDDGFGELNAPAPAAAPVKPAAFINSRRDVFVSLFAIFSLSHT